MTDIITVKSSPSPPPPPPRKEGLLHHLLTKFAAEVFVTAVAAYAATRLLAYQQLPTILILVAVVAIVLTYFAVLVVSYFFSEDLWIARNWRPHVTLLLVFIAMVAAPLVVMQTLADATTNELRSQIEQQKKALEVVEASQQTGDQNRLQLYASATKSMERILSRSTFGTSDFKDLLNDCITSVYTTNAKAKKAGDLRAAVFYAKGKYLIMPPHAYEGRGLHEGIEKLRFDLSARTSDEPREVYCQRLGIAGWCYVNGTDVRAADVLHIPSAESYCYRPATEPQNESADRAMICVTIPDLTNPQRISGVLAISSLTPGIFTENDKAIAQFFATLLGKYDIRKPNPQALAGK